MIDRPEFTFKLSEIHGVPEVKGESIMDVMVARVNFELKEDRVDAVHLSV